MNTTTKIKPCPFCGKSDIGVKDNIIEFHMNGKDMPCSAIRKVWAYCRYCGATGRTGTGDFVYDDEIIAMATELWNKRIEPQAGSEEEEGR